MPFLESNSGVSLESGKWREESGGEILIQGGA